jgi:hypothetical protein
MLHATRSWTADAFVPASRIRMLPLTAVPLRRMTHQKQHLSWRAAVHDRTPRCSSPPHTGMVRQLVHTFVVLGRRDPGGCPRRRAGQEGWLLWWPDERCATGGGTSREAVVDWLHVAAQRRHELATAETARHPRGGITEPGFRVIFPVSAHTPEAGEFRLDPTTGRAVRRTP